MRGVINDNASGVMATAAGTEVIVLERDGKTLIVQLPPESRKFKHKYAGKQCRVLAKWVDIEAADVPEKETPQDQEEPDGDPEAEEGAGDQDVAGDEAGDTGNPDSDGGDPEGDAPDEAPDDDATAGDDDGTPATPPAQTEMFVKNELDDATAVLGHLGTLVAKARKAVKTAHDNLYDAETRRDQQQHVVNKLQAMMPAAAPTTDETTSVCVGADCGWGYYKIDSEGPAATGKAVCESLKGDLEEVVVGESPCPEVHVEKAYGRSRPPRPAPAGRHP